MGFHSGSLYHIQRPETIESGALISVTASVPLTLTFFASCSPVHVSTYGRPILPGIVYSY